MFLESFAELEFCIQGNLSTAPVAVAPAAAAATGSTSYTVPRPGSLTSPAPPDFILGSNMMVNGRSVVVVMLSSYFACFLTDKHSRLTWWLSGRASDLRSSSRGVRAPAATLLRNNLRQVVHTLLPLSPSSIIWYQRKLGSKRAYRVVHQPVSRGFAVFADAWLSGWLAEISADLRETVAH